MAVALLVLLLAAPPAVASPSCPVRAPRLRFAVVDHPVALLHSQSIDAMHAESGQRRTRRRHHLALTTSSVEWQSELNAHVSLPAGGHGQVCAVPAEVVLTLVEAEHQISMAREIPAGSCLYNAVLAHERRHASANKQSLAVAVQSARQAAQAWARRASGFGADAEIAMARLQDGLKRAMAPSLAAMRTARATAHARIDTPAEYRRLASVCPEDQTRLRTAMGD